MPTIHEVARAAGVGVGTASRALSGNQHVTYATRARVRAAAERLGFRPSPIARAFSRGRTQTLEVVVPLITRHFYVEVLRGIEGALAATDYSLLIRTIERRASAAAASAVRHLLERGHRRIALVDHAEDPFTPVCPDERHRGYRRALAEAGLAERPDYERVTDFSPEARAAAMRD